MKKLLIGIVVFFFVPGTAYAATYYVSPTGSDANSGSLTQPWATIQKAANTMSAGDTAIVTAGNYSSQRVLVSKSGLAAAPITFKAQGSVLMKGFRIVANYITVDGFEIANTDYVRWTTAVSSGISILGANNTIINNYVHDTSLEAINIDGNPAKGTTTVSANNVIKNNKIYRSENIGIVINGRSNLIEGNEIWATVQCHPNMTRVEDAAPDENGAKCPYYPVVPDFDADGMRFFGQGHIVKNNSIHDIKLTDTINGALVNINPHIDCFQTYANSTSETAQNITFDGNYCENLTLKMSGFMLQGGANHLYIRNNIIKAAVGMNTGNVATNGGSDYLYIDNNIWANNLAFGTQDYPSVVGITGIPSVHADIRNNIFYDQPAETVSIIGDTSNATVDYNLAYNSNGTTPTCIKWGTYSTCQPAPNHELWKVNPLFVNVAANDFHLQPTSTAIDKGASLGSLVVADKDGISRPQGAAYDIGPYEYISGSSPTPVAVSGDANGDGHVDEADYGIWLSHFGTTITGGASVGDFDANGMVDGVDFAIWLKYYGA